jgi:glycerol-3-phosphate dehydrogenase (NAD(P)+)
MRTAVFGGGAWGTAIACHAARQGDALLWLRDGEQCAHVARSRENARYLPGVSLPDTLILSADLAQACHWLAQAPSLAVLGVPMAGLRGLLGELVSRLPAACAGVVWLCKGIDVQTGELPHQLAQPFLGMLPGAALSGPGFAQEVAAGLPTALTLASSSAALVSATRQGLHHAGLRVYQSDDPIGVELGGALKNVMAIAAGISDGLELGLNARAALITRGLAEITRLGLAMGARAATFTGLTGLGDLVLTCTGALSRNRRIGLAIAQGLSLPQALHELGHVAEGVACAPVALSLARRYGVEMPILEAVVAVLEGRLAPREAVLGLLAREPRNEHD